MTDEDFQQTMLDYFGIEAQRHRDIMANIEDVKKQNEEIKAAVTSLTTSVHKALGDLAATGAAGHAAVLDTIVADQAAVLNAVKSSETELTAAVNAVPVPAAPPTSTANA